MTGEPADTESLDPAATVRGYNGYHAVFAAIADGRNRMAALVLRSLTPENLAELHVICGDVRTMVEAEQHRRAGTLPDSIDDAIAGIDDETRGELRVALRRARGEESGS